jgi:hypothetical protein
MDDKGKKYLDFYNEILLAKRQILITNNSDKAPYEQEIIDIEVIYIFMGDYKISAYNIFDILYTLITNYNIIPYN